MGSGVVFISKYCVLEAVPEDDGKEQMVTTEKKPLETIASIIKLDSIIKLLG